MVTAGIALPIGLLGPPRSKALPETISTSVITPIKGESKGGRWITLKLSVRKRSSQGASRLKDSTVPSMAPDSDVRARGIAALGPSMRCSLRELQVEQMGLLRDWEDCGGRKLSAA